MTALKEPSRRRLLAAATVGLAPISLALWLTYPATATEGAGSSRGVNQQSAHRHSDASNSSAPGGRSLKVVGTASGS
jgi:hypothetical protein